MTIAKVTMKSQIKKHSALAGRNEKLATDIHVAACEDLQHAALHGDVSLCKDLYDKLGGAMSSARTATLKAWFVLMSGNQMTAEKGEWKLKKGWTADKFTLDKAEATPYWTLAGEIEPKNLSLEQILKIMGGLTKRIDKAVENDKFKGDSVAAKDIVTAVVDFATERAKRLTAQQRGMAAEVSEDESSEDKPRAMAVEAADSKGQVTEDQTSQPVSAVA